MNEIKVAAGINVFNDCKSLARTLQTTTQYFDRLYIVDGRYPDYVSEADEKYSNDGTIELIAQYENCVYVPLFAEQKVKRTKYLKMCKDDNIDFLVVIDADEYMKVQSWSEFQNNLQRQILNMPDRARFYQYQIDYEAEPNKTIALPRLVYRPYNLMHINHWTLIEDPEVTNKSIASSTTIRGISIVTDDLLRPITRLQYDCDYQWLLFFKEKVITEKVYNDPECKQNFLNHLIHEINVWKEEKDKLTAKEKLIESVKHKKL